MWHNVLTGSQVYDAMRTDAAGRTFDRSALVRAVSFRATVGQPLTIRRSKALSDVLREIDLIHFPGELLVGSSVGRLVPKSDVLQKQLDHAQPILDATRSRDFLSHNDHHAPDYPALLRLGIAGLARQARESLARQDDPKRRVFLQSVLIALDGLREHLRRWAGHVPPHGSRPSRPCPAPGPAGVDAAPSG